MRAKLGLVVVVLVISTAVALLDYSHSPSQLRQANNVRMIAQPAPDFRFSLVDTEKSYALLDFKGKTILINFWASWCVPCLYEFPILIDLAEQYPDKLVLIMLSEDDTAQQAYDFSRGFCMQRGIMDPDTKKLFPDSPNIYIAWDKDKYLAQKVFQTARYPESIIITPDLMIKEKIVGILTEENLREIRQLLDEG